MAHDTKHSRHTSRPRGRKLKQAIKKAMRQMSSMLPVILGVILLVGFFQTFVPKSWVKTLFSGSSLPDAFAGAVCGSILTGNPVNSYVIGNAFLEMGVALIGVTAFILTWVTVGLIQLPAEIAALGVRFALVRIVAAFALSLPVAWLAACFVGGIP